MYVCACVYICSHVCVCLYVHVACQDVSHCSLVYHGPVKRHIASLVEDNIIHV